MGLYLNSGIALVNYARSVAQPYFVDKSAFLAELIPLVAHPPRYVCVTRPRRFGKSMNAAMIAGFFGKNEPQLLQETFGQLQVAAHPQYQQHLGQHNVVYMDLSRHTRQSSYAEFKAQVQQQLFADLQSAYPEVPLASGEAIWKTFTRVFQATGAVFIFVVDEWDAIFSQQLTTTEQADYLNFLRDLFKDQPYVEFAYMTGVMPIPAYSSGSALNMFSEYTMSIRKKYAEYFGFTHAEVEQLYQRYLANTAAPSISFADLEHWYDGYVTASGIKLFNPWSIVEALVNDEVGNYWTAIGPYDELFNYVRHNVHAVQYDITTLIAGGRVSASLNPHSVTAMQFNTRESILSAMVVYGFLTVDGGFLRIPNQELLDKFVEMVSVHAEVDYFAQLQLSSQQMLQATVAGDTETMVKILQQVHDTEATMLNYSNEEALAHVVITAYLAARSSYEILREEKAGHGFADFIFIPRYDKTLDCLIIELKVDAQPEVAIEQIRSRGYATYFSGYLGQEPKYKGRILAVGISYFRSDPEKKHYVAVEVLRESEDRP